MGGWALGLSGGSAPRNEFVKGSLRRFAPLTNSGDGVRKLTPPRPWRWRERCRVHGSGLAGTRAMDENGAALAGQAWWGRACAVVQTLGWQGVGGCALGLSGGSAPRNEFVKGSLRRYAPLTNSGDGVRKLTPPRPWRWRERCRVHGSGLAGTRAMNTIGVALAGHALVGQGVGGWADSGLAGRGRLCPRIVWGLRPPERICQGFASPLRALDKFGRRGAQAYPASPLALARALPRSRFLACPHSCHE